LETRRSLARIQITAGGDSPGDQIKSRGPEPIREGLVLLVLTHSVEGRILNYLTALSEVIYQGVFWEGILSRAFKDSYEDL
jgi:hypothetical protein